MAIFTVNAAEKVKTLLAEEKDKNLHFRVLINGGGCSGFQYNIVFDDKKFADDIIITQNCQGQEVELLIDAISYQYLKNATIDYVSGIQGEEFRISNPDAKRTCGCGSSFSVDDE